MRLGQLARSLNTTPKEIIAYLNDKGIEVKSSHPNSKLDESAEQDVVAAFSKNSGTEAKTDVNIQKEQPESATITAVNDATEQEKEDETPAGEDEKVTTTESLIEQVEPEAEPTDTLHESVEPSVSQEESVEVSEDSNEATEQEPVEGGMQLGSEEEVEVIKAPKIELPGLKVVGKIELPEPKSAKKELEEDLEESADGEVKSGEATENKEEVVPEVRYYKPELKKKRHPKKKKNKRPPLTEEEKEQRRIKSKQAREKRKAEEARKEQERLERQIKEKRRKHYEQKVKQAKPVKTNQKKKPTTTTKASSKRSNKDQPKTVLGKFWKWLNT